MFRLIIVAVFIFTPVLANAQTPGVDPRGLMIHSPTVIIGVVEEPWQRVIRPDRIPKGRREGNCTSDGTYIVELLPISRDFMVGYIYYVRVQEVLKGDQWVRKNQIIQIFVPDNLEGGASLATNQRFLLALAGFEPKKEVFANTSVGRVGEPLTRPGVAFHLRARYYQVASDRNGAIAITDKNLKFIEEIKSAIRNGPYWFHRFSFRRERIPGFAGSPQIVR